MKKLVVALGALFTVVACAGKIDDRSRAGDDPVAFNAELLPPPPVVEEQPPKSACPNDGEACESPLGKGFCAFGQCAVCIDAVDDGRCIKAYGQGHLCSGATCVKGECHDSSACSGGLCMASTCGACASDGECEHDPAYGPGTMCVAGVCVSTTCPSLGTPCANDPSRMCCLHGTANACVVGDCCEDAQCPAATPSCVAHKCQ